jgi:perosamine synthetase
MPEDVFPRLRKTLASGHVAAGAETELFEQAVAAFTGNPDTVAIGNISAALTLALHAAGVGPGDEVVVSPMTCLATAMPIANLAARPVWCDVDPLTGMPDPAMLRSRVTPRTRALLFYHWAGDVGAIEDIVAVALDTGLPLIEDASEALGAEAGEQRLGTHGAAYTAYSFGPVRQISCGEGAALCLGSGVDAGRIRRLRRYGIDNRTFRLANGDLNPASDIEEPGFHCGLDNIAASIGLAQWHWAERNVRAHRDNGLFYESALGAIPGIRLLRRRADAHSAYWIYTLRAERRDRLIAKLHGAGIGAQRMHLRLDRYSCFAKSNAGERPGVDAFDAENLAIPCGWWVTATERERVAATIREGW